MIFSFTGWFSSDEPGSRGGSSRHLLHGSLQIIIVQHSGGTNSRGYGGDAGLLVAKCFQSAPGARPSSPARDRRPAPTVEQKSRPRTAQGRGMFHRELGEQG